MHTYENERPGCTSKRGCEISLLSYFPRLSHLMFSEFHPFSYTFHFFTMADPNSIHMSTTVHYLFTSWWLTPCPYYCDHSSVKHGWAGTSVEGCRVLCQPLCFKKEQPDKSFSSLRKCLSAPVLTSCALYGRHISFVTMIVSFPMSQVNFICKPPCVFWRKLLGSKQIWLDARLRSRGRLFLVPPPKKKIMKEDTREMSASASELPIPAPLNFMCGTFRRWGHAGHPPVDAICAACALCFWPSWARIVFLSVGSRIFFFTKEAGWVAEYGIHSDFCAGRASWNLPKPLRWVLDLSPGPPFSFMIYKSEGAVEVGFTLCFPWWRQTGLIFFPPH